jgi:hypothetical protein
MMNNGKLVQTMKARGMVSDSMIVQELLKSKKATGSKFIVGSGDEILCQH